MGGFCGTAILRRYTQWGYESRTGLTFQPVENVTLRDDFGTYPQATGGYDMFYTVNVMKRGQCYVWKLDSERSKLLINKVNVVMLQCYVTK